MQKNRVEAKLSKLTQELEQLERIKQGIGIIQKLGIVASPVDSELKSDYEVFSDKFLSYNKCGQSQQQVQEVDNSVMSPLDVHRVLINPNRQPETNDALTTQSS